MRFKSSRSALSPTFAKAFHLILPITRITRSVQAQFPQRPIRGLTRLSNILNRWLPAYQGPIRLPDGVYLNLDSTQPAERWLLYSGNYQPALTAALKEYVKPGAYCLDVGANLGFYTVMFAQWAGQTGHVVGFEANPTMVQRAQKNIDLNQFAHAEVVNAAVHNKAETIAFFVSSSPGKSSINAIDNPVEKIVMQSITLDDFVIARRWPRLDLIKIDIEGNDCNAILGASRILAQFHPVMAFEYKATTPIEAANAVFALLSGLGYTLQMVRRNGQRIPFNEQSARLADVDILCVPPGRSMKPFPAIAAHI